MGKNRRKYVLVALVSVVALPGDANMVMASSNEHGESWTPTAIARQMTQSPVRFEPNVGQWDDRIKFLARLQGTQMFLTNDGVTLTHKNATVTLKLLGADVKNLHGEQLLTSESNFFLGNDPARWRTKVANYAQVRATTTTSGVDVVWHAPREGAGLEYDVEVASNVDATQIGFEIDGGDALSIDDDGALRIATAAGTFVQQAPRVTQAGREVPAHYRQATFNRAWLVMNGYDARKPVLIDPVLTYSTYLGGSANDDEDAGPFTGIALDANGNAYVTGFTKSTNFPTMSPLQATNHGGYEVFISKLNPTGSALVYSTYLGGTGDDCAINLAVDANGNAYVTGVTYSSDYPTKNAFQSANAGGSDAFITEVSASGSALVYSTYLGGGGAECGRAIALDAAGSAYVTGYTQSTDFPTKNPLQTSNAGGSYDMFVSKLSSTGSSLVYSTYLGGAGEDRAEGLAVDSSGAYVTGLTNSTNFPTQGAIQSTEAGGYDVVVAKLNAAGSALSYSTFLGGTTDDIAYAIALDAAGDAYVTGTTASANFPTKNAAQSAKGGNYDAFISALNPAGTALVYSTYLGGSANEIAYGIAVDTTGSAYVTGNTLSSDFPIKAAIQPSAGGAFDGFLSKLSPTGAALVFSTYLGGGNYDGGGAVATDSNGAVYVTGYTASANFPTKSPIQATNAGGNDVFITKIRALSLGVTCAAANECISGFCVDGVCCDTSCTDQCQACDSSSQLGTCTTIAGPPHGSRPTCPGSGACGAVCDGTDTKTCIYPTTQCGSTCSNGSEVDSQCDGFGKCVAQPPRSCGNLVCADATKCNTTCTTTSDCASGFTCVTGACVPSFTCQDEHTSKQADGTLHDCGPFKCTTSGECGTVCASVDDCVAPNVCDTSGRCGPLPTSGGCLVTSAWDRDQPWWIALFAIVMWKGRRGLKTVRT